MVSPNAHKVLVDNGGLGFNLDGGDNRLSKGDKVQNTIGGGDYSLGELIVVHVKSKDDWDVYVIPKKLKKDYVDGNDLINGAPDEKWDIKNWKISFTPMFNTVSLAQSGDYKGSNNVIVLDSAVGKKLNHGGGVEVLKMEINSTINNNQAIVIKTPPNGEKRFGSGMIEQHDYYRKLFSLVYDGEPIGDREYRDICSLEGVLLKDDVYTQSKETKKRVG